jgi:hypothetical protein
MFCVPHGGKLFEEDEAEAWTFSAEDVQHEAVRSVEGPMAELRDIGVTSLTLAVILETPPNDLFPLHYPSLTRYRDDRTYSSAQLDRVRTLQQTITVLVVEEIWGVVPDEMQCGDGLFVRVAVDLGTDWESTTIKGYAGVLKTQRDLRNVPFILK